MKVRVKARREGGNGRKSVKAYSAGVHAEKLKKKDFNGDYGVKLTPQKLRIFFEIKQPYFNVGWPAKGTIDREITG